MALKDLIDNQEETARTFSLTNNLSRGLGDNFSPGVQGIFDTSVVQEMMKEISTVNKELGHERFNMQHVLEAIQDLSSQTGDTPDAATQETIDAILHHIKIQSEEEVENITQLMNPVKANLTEVSTNLESNTEKVIDLIEVIDENSGLNSNIKKLTEVVKKSITVMSAAQKSDAEFNENEAKRYVPDVTDDKERPTTFSGLLKDKWKKVKGDGLIDFSEGKSKGIIGDLLRNRKAKTEDIARRASAKDEFVKNMRVMEKGYEGRDFNKNADGTVNDEKVNAHWGEVFEKQNVVRGKMSANESRIKELTEQGYSEKDIQELGLRREQEKLTDEFAESRPGLAKARKTEKAQALANLNEDDEGKSSLGKTTREEPRFSLSRESDDEGSELTTASDIEAHSEDVALMKDQTEVLSRIEENTRTGAGKVKPVAEVVESSTKSSLSSLGPWFSGFTSLLKSGLVFALKGALVAGAAYVGYKAGGLINDHILNPIAEKITGVKGETVGTALYTGVDKVKGFFGASDEDKLKEADKNAQIKHYEGKKESGEKISQDLATKLKGYGIEVDKAMINAPKGNQTPASNVTPEVPSKVDTSRVIAPPTNTADVVNEKTAEVNAANASENKPVAQTVVNAPQSTVVNNTSNYPSKIPARNTESSLREYNRYKYNYGM